VVHRGGMVELLVAGPDGVLRMIGPAG